MPDKLDRCVADVKAKGHADEPYAVCNASINELEPLIHEVDDMMSKMASFPDDEASYGHTGQMSPKNKASFVNTPDEMDLNETTSIPGSLSAVSIKGKKKEARPMKETLFKSILDSKLNSCGCKKKR